MHWHAVGTYIVQFRHHLEDFFLSAPENVLIEHYVTFSDETA